ncbi:MAG: YbjQ family protein [Dongiaceae bacterium]
MIVTTTHAIEERRVTDYLGVVHGCAVMGSNLFRDFFANIRDVVGGRVGSYETVLSDAKDAALTDLVARAEAMHADAVIGVSFDSDSIGGDNKTILMVSATGTAVRLG